MTHHDHEALKPSPSCLAFREAGTWKAILTNGPKSIPLYEGKSADKAQDMADAVNNVLQCSKVSCHTFRDADRMWHASITGENYGPETEDHFHTVHILFSTRNADTVADLAAQVNEVLKGE